MKSEHSADSSQMSQQMNRPKNWNKHQFNFVSESSMASLKNREGSETNDTFAMQQKQALLPQNQQHRDSSDQAFYLKRAQ